MHTFVWDVGCVGGSEKERWGHSARASKPLHHHNQQQHHQQQKQLAPAPLSPRPSPTHPLSTPLRTPPQAGSRSCFARAFDAFARCFVHLAIFTAREPLKKRGFPGCRGRGEVVYDHCIVPELYCTAIVLYPPLYIQFEFEVGVGVAEIRGWRLLKII